MKKCNWCKDSIEGLWISGVGAEIFHKKCYISMVGFEDVKSEYCNNSKGYCSQLLEPASKGSINVGYRCRHNRSHDLVIDSAGNILKGLKCIGFYNDEKKVKHGSGVKLEIDPYAKGQHEPGAKLDAGKPRMGLVLGKFGNALKAVAEVGTYGAKKYSDNGWLDVPQSQERYTDAGLRHEFAYLAGEECDSDTNLLHLAHRAWNSLAVLELKLREMKKL